MKIITLGTGNAFTSDGRANASVLLDGTFKVLFDCSPQTISSLRKLNLAPNQIDYIFFLMQTFQSFLDDFPSLLKHQRKHQVEMPENIRNHTFHLLRLHH